MNLTRSTSAFVRTFALLAAVVFAANARAATPATIDVDVDKPGATIPPLFYGLMTEEINHAYDGGLYAELIQNRTFQDNPKTPLHWSLIQQENGPAKMEMDRNDPVNPALPVSLRLGLAGSPAGIANDGFWGIPVRPDTKYIATFYAKASNGFAGAIDAAIVLDDKDATAAHARTDPITAQWQKYTLTLTTPHDIATTAKAKFMLGAQGKGSVSFSLVSLFPPTYQDAPNGLRPDIMKLLADMHPAFIRLPGGNYLEGDTFPTRFNWKQMIGPVDQRPGHMGCWKYRSSDGFGLPEYLLWCRQLHAEPVLAVFAGYTLNHDSVAAGPALQPYVDEALEEIEYVTGDAATQWGKQRIADGQTEPFTLHYVEIGNEDWFDRKAGGYDARFAQFFDSIRAKYPNLKIIATAHVHSRTPDLYDDHYYRSARQLAFGSNHYDLPADPSAPGHVTFNGGHHDGVFARTGPKYFIGEWATQEGRPTPDLNAALADAAWLMGLERNADLVDMECYAPLFVNVNPGAWQWPTNLIGYDALNSFGSPSYYAQSMIAQNRGDVVLPTHLTVAEKIAATDPVPHGAIGVGVWHTQSEYKDITVTRGDQTLLTAELTKDTSGWTFTGPKWNLQDASIKPAGANSETWAITGDAKWTDYTIKLKARKISGSEGFLILYHATDADNYSWWNIGGWRNTATGLEATHEASRESFGSKSNFKVETGKWYDLKIEVTGHAVKCYIDDKFVTEGTEHPTPIGTPLFANAGYLNASHEVIVKVVNFGNDPIDATLNLQGAGSISSQGKAIVLAGEPKDVNSIEEPTKVAPKEEPITDAAASFKRTFPPHSLTLLRLIASP